MSFLVDIWLHMGTRKGILKVFFGVAQQSERIHSKLPCIDSTNEDALHHSITDVPHESQKHLVGTLLEFLLEIPGRASS
jgi:hypothetical protein